MRKDLSTQLLFRLIVPALVLSVNVASGAEPTLPLAVAPALERLTVTGKLVLIEPASVVAVSWKLVVPGRFRLMVPALVSKSYVPVVPMLPVKLIVPALDLSIELPVNDDCVASMVPALLTKDILPLTPFTWTLPAFDCICRSVEDGTVIVKSTLVELKKLNVPEL